MKFDGWLWALLFAVPALLLAWWRLQKPVRVGMRYSDLSLLRRLVGSSGQHREKILWVLRLAVVALVLLALARPQSEKRLEETETEGIDIMLALDVSGSMKAEDFQPYNRLQVAKEVIEDFVAGLKSDRVGLVVFAAEAFTQCPLTLDYQVLLHLLDYVDFGMLRDGTAIGMAITTSLNRLKESSAKSKVIILLTDGVNNTGAIDPITAAEVAKALGVRIYAVGVGKPGGAAVPLDDPLRPFLPGSSAQAEFDEATLKRIAQISGGAYYHAADKSALSSIYKSIWRLEKTRFKVKQHWHYEELFAYLLTPALMLLLIEVLLTNTVLRKFP